MSKFYTIFSACSKREISGFHKFVRQSHKKRTDLLELLRHVRNVHGSPDVESKLEPSICCHEIYGKETEGNYRSVLNMMSELHLMLKGYLLSERIKKDVLESRSLWLSILSEKGLEEDLSKQAEKDIVKCKAKPIKSIMDYLNLFVLQHQYYYNFTNDSATDGIAEVKKTADALNAFTQVLRLRMLCETLQLKSKLPAEFPVDNLIEALNVQNHNFSPDHVLPYLYNELRILLETKDIEQFDRLTGLVSKNAHRISAKELDEFILYLNSFLSTISRMNHADKDVDRTHRLNMIALENEAYFHQRNMRVAHYLNIVTAACKAKDFKWAAHFADTCKKLLPELNKEDAFTLSEAIIHFEKREYNSILKLLKDKDSKDVSIQIRIKAFMVVCHFELKNSGGDLLEYCTNLEAYLKRNLKLKEYKEAVLSVLNMIRIVKMLYFRDVSKQSIVDQINMAPLPAFRNWLQEKAEGYRKN